MKTILSFSPSDETSAQPCLPQSERKSIKIISGIGLISFTRFYAVKEYVPTHDPQIHMLLYGTRSENHVRHPDIVTVQTHRHASNATLLLTLISPSALSFT